jgi:23S rRNA pseudouridine2605 synthase
MSYARKKKATVRRGSSGGDAKGRKPGGRKKTTKKKVTRKARRTIESRPDGVRLNKYLADQGVASRRAADTMIEEGHVTVDGVTVEELGLRVDPQDQVIEIDGEPLAPSKSDRKRYYLLNKPAGVVCTNERRETRPRAIDLITDRAKGRIYTVGRLDEESKGLLILTNDGDFANRVMHPRFGVTKTYAVKLRGRISDEDVQRVREGVFLAEGRAAQSRVLIKKRSREYSHLEVTLHEGKNREIRRIFLSVGFKVVELRRSHIGTLSDRKLKIGYWRYLELDEVQDLLALSAGEEPESAPKGRGRKKTQRRTKRTVRKAGSNRRGSQ